MDPRNPASHYFYNRQNTESEWEEVKDEEQAERVKGYVTRPLPTLPPDKADLPSTKPPGSPEDKVRNKDMVRQGHGDARRHTAARALAVGEGGGGQTLADPMAGCCAG